MATLLKGAAFITGAASGIGQHTALSFAKYGITRLALADMNAKNLAASIKSLKEKFPNLDILDLQMNVQSTPEVKAGIAETVKRFGRLDVAVNNAGIGGSGNLSHETEESEFQQVVDVDLHGVWRCQREELAVMVKQEDLGLREGRGRIINVASMYGVIAPGAMLRHTAYATAKHGVIGLTKGDGNNYGPLGIRINAICPGYVDTPLFAKSLEDAPDSPVAKDIAASPLQRAAMMEEIGDAITYLASPLSSYMQGAAMVVDGGYTTQ